MGHGIPLEEDVDLAGLDSTLFIGISEEHIETTEQEVEILMTL